MWASLIELEQHSLCTKLFVGLTIVQLLEEWMAPRVPSQAVDNEQSQAPIISILGTASAKGCPQLYKEFKASPGYRTLSEKKTVKKKKNKTDKNSL